MSPTDEPRSYGELAIGAVKQYKRPVFAALAIVFFIIAAFNVAFVIHIEVTELGLVQDINRETDFALEEKLGGYYANAIIYSVLAAACAYEWETAQ